MKSKLMSNKPEAASLSSAHSGVWYVRLFMMTNIYKLKMDTVI